MKNSKPDENEVVADRFLRSSGFDSRFEPRGYKTFPDFGINEDGIGVEVRSLVQTRQTSLGEPLETINNSLWDRADNLLASLGRADLPMSYVVRIQFVSPIPRWPKIEEAVRTHLARTADGLVCSQLPIADNVSISVLPSGSKRDRPFLFGGIADLEHGGFVVASILEALFYAVEEKSKKEKKARPHGYTRLWLILVNHIDSHLTSDEIANIQNQIEVSAPWERIFLLGPDAAVLAEWPLPPKPQRV